MKKASTFTMLAAGALMSLSAATFAQQPAPQDRTMNPSDRLQGGYANPADANPSMNRGPYNRGGTAYNPASDRVPRDRFGNVIRGNECRHHWANCAFDPSNPMPQQSQAPR